MELSRAEPRFAPLDNSLPSSYMSGGDDDGGGGCCCLSLSSGAFVACVVIISSCDTEPEFEFVGKQLVHSAALVVVVVVVCRHGSGLLLSHRIASFGSARLGLAS